MQTQQHLTAASCVKPCKCTACTAAAHIPLMGFALSVFRILNVVKGGEQSRPSRKSQESEALHCRPRLNKKQSKRSSKTNKNTNSTHPECCNLIFYSDCMKAALRHSGLNKHSVAGRETLSIFSTNRTLPRTTNRKTSTSSFH